MKVTTCPLVHCHDLFSFILNEKNWSFCWFSLPEIKCTEHWCCTQIGLINKLILKLIKWKFCLSDGICLSITNEDILDDSKLFTFMMLICFIWIANKHETVFFRLPHCQHSYLEIVNIILQSHLLLYNILIIFSLSIVSQVISLKSPLIIMSCLKPCHHWVIIGLSY